MTTVRQSGKYLNTLLLICLALIWGSSFILMKKGLMAFPPLQLAGFRVFVSFLVLSPFLFSALRSFKKSQIPFLLIVSLFGSGIPAVFFAISLTKVDSSVAGIINSMVPLFTLVIGMLFFKTVFRTNQFIGVLTGLMGVCLLVLINSDGGLSTTYIYALLPVLATICYGTNTNLLKKHFNEIHPLHLASLIYLVVGVPGGLYVMFSDFKSIVINHEFGRESMMYIILLAVLGSAIGMVLFTKLIQRTSAIFASTVTYLVPIVAIVWGVIDGENLGIIQVFGMLLILGGVYIVNRNFYRLKSEKKPIDSAGKI